MVAKLLSTDKLRWIGIISFVVAIITIAMITYFPNYTKLKELKDENKRLIGENKILEQEIVDYGEKIKKIEEDPYILEKIARDEIGVVKDNEIVIDIGE